MTQPTRQQQIEALAELVQSSDPSLTLEQCRAKASDLIAQMDDIQAQIKNLRERLGR